MEYMNTKELVTQLSTEMSKSDVAYVLGLSRQRVQLILGTETGERQAADLYKDLVDSGAWEIIQKRRGELRDDGGPIASVADVITAALVLVDRIEAEYQDGGQIYILKTKVAPDCMITIATEGSDQATPAP